MRDDLQRGPPIEIAGKDQPRHRDARFVRPAERPPQLELRLLLCRVIGKGPASRGVQPDGAADLRHALEDRQEVRLVQRTAVHVRKHLDSRRAEVADGAVDLPNRRVRVVHRHRCDKPGETAGMPRHRCGHGIVGDSRQLRRLLGRAKRFKGRRGEAQHLHVVVEQIHHPEPLVQIDHGRDSTHAFLHIRSARGHGRHPIEVRGRKDVAEQVDLHERRL